MEIRVPRVRVIGADGERLACCRATKRSRWREESGSTWSRSSRTPIRRSAGSWTTASSSSKRRRRPTPPRRSRSSVEIKELKFRPTTDDGDYEIKLRNLRRFLEEGDKVKVNIRFRGREMAHTRNSACAMAKRIEADLEDEVDHRAASRAWKAGR